VNLNTTAAGSRLFVAGSYNLTFSGEGNSIFTALNGNVSTNATLTVSSTSNFAQVGLFGNLSGNGNLVVDNSGHFTFGSNIDSICSLIGDITVSSNGTLVNQGTINHSDTAIIVYDTATFQNNGTVNRHLISHGTVTGVGQFDTMEQYGRTSPGNSIGTLTAAGDVTHRTGSCLRIEFNPVKESDFHEVGGTFTIEDGVTFEPMPQAGNYTSSFVYPVVSAGNGVVVGSFDTVTEINPNNITTGAYFIEHQPNAINLHFFATKCTPTFLVSNLSEQANNFQVNIASYEANERIILWDRECSTPREKYQGYVVGDYANGHTKETDYMIGSSYTIGGLQLGTNIMATDTILTSAFFGYSHGTSKSYNNCTEVDSNNYTGGLLAQFFGFDVCSMDLSLMYTWASFDAKRIGANSGSTSANLLNSQFRVVFDKMWKKVKFCPILGARYLGNWVNSYTEDEDKLDRLTYGSDNWNELALLGGLLISRTFKTDRTNLTPHIKGEWIQRVVNKTHTVTFDHSQRLYLASNANIKNEDNGFLNVSAGLSGVLRNCVTIDGTYAMNFFQKSAPTHDYRLSIAWHY